MCSGRAKLRKINDVMPTFLIEPKVYIDSSLLDKRITKLWLFLRTKQSVNLNRLYNHNVDIYVARPNSFAPKPSALMPQEQIKLASH